MLWSGLISGWALLDGPNIGHLKGNGSVFANLGQMSTACQYQLRYDWSMKNSQGPNVKPPFWKCKLQVPWKLLAMFCESCFEHLSGLPQGAQVLRLGIL